MARGVISVTGHRVRDMGAHCKKCQERIVQIEGGLCSLCRESARDHKAMGAIVLICLCAALLVMGFMAAHATFVAMN
jgi:hypothetical protein